MDTGLAVDDLDSRAGGILRSLIDRLVEAGYAEFFSCFNPLRPRPDDWIRARDGAPDSLRPLLDLFLLRRSVPNEALGPIEDLLGGLVGLHVCLLLEGNQFATPGLVLVPVLNNWLFCQPPQAQQTLYFGDDSLALLLRTRVPRGSRCLDLCSGPGIQALNACHDADHVDAVEINPVAAGLARINVLINGAEDRVSVHCGDLYQPVLGERYDLVIANPPLLPFPDTIPYPLIGHGGPDGMRITWRILEGLAGALQTDGAAQLIGCCLSDGILPLCLRQLEAWATKARMKVLLTITAHQPVHRRAAYFEFLVDSAARSTGLNPETVANLYTELLEASKATHLCPYFMLVRRGVGQVSLQDLSHEGTLELWYVGRSG